MQHVPEQRSCKISLLHATYRAGEAAVATRKRWLELASRQNLIEHIFAFNADDDVSSSTPQIYTSGLALPAEPGRVTAVRNWNAAASVASGSILVVVADDLVPSTEGWDLQLWSVVGCLEPLHCSFIVKIQDSDDPSDHLIRHPIVSRAYLQQYGLFKPIYRGIGADNDFTFSAHCRGLVIDGRGVRFEHRHPTRGSTPTESQSAISSAAELDYGKSVLNSRWPRWRRRILFTYHAPAQQKASLPRTARAQKGMLACGGVFRPPTITTLRRLVRARRSARGLSPQ